MMHKQRLEPGGAYGPTYARIADQIEMQITLGNLLPGQRVPTARELAEQYDTSISTGGMALRRLREAGRIRSEPTGCVVSENPTATAPHERLAAAEVGASIMRPGESALITLADHDPDPAPHVLSQLGLPPGASVIRREYVMTNHHGYPVGAGVSYVSGELADLVPALLVAAPIPGGIITAIRLATGRKTVDTPSILEVREPTERERRDLALTGDYTGDVLAVDTRCIAADGTVIEYAQIVHPRGVIVSMRHG